MKNTDVDTKLDEILRKITETSAEIKEIKLKVETIAINQKDLKEKVENLEKSGKMKVDHQYIDGSSEQLERIDRILASIDNSYKFLEISVQKQEKYAKLKADELTKAIEGANENEKRMKEQNEKIAKSVEDCLRTFDEKLEKSDSLTTNRIPKQAHKCNNCSFELVESPRGDGVSVQCSNPNCREWNIVGQLQPGNRWVSISGCWHVQQISADKKPRETVNCKVCSKHDEGDHL